MLVATLCLAERNGLERDADTERAALAIDASLDDRLLAWSRSHRDAAAACAALGRVTATLWWTTAAVLLVATLAGIGAAQTALAASDDSTNVVRLMVGLLGVQSLVLFAWLLFMFIGPRAVPTASIGGLLLTILRSPHLLGRNQAPVAKAALAITWRRFTSGSPARWRFGALSNGAWTMFNIGCIAMLLLLLSTQEHRFHWETTILSAGHYARIAEWLGWLPSVLGFPVPTAGDIVATESSRHSAELADGVRLAWSGFVVGSLVTYALLPRAALTIACLLPAAGRAHAQRILDDPAVAAVRERLRSPVRTHVVDPDAVEHVSIPAHASLGHAHSASAPTGSPVLVAVEPPRVWTPWPPAVDGITWNNFGVIDDRAARDRVAHALRAASPAPRCVVAACSVLNSPDRGQAALLTHLGEASGAPMIVLLSDGQALRERSPSDPSVIESRIGLWRQMLDRIGVGADAVLEIDLEHLTDRSTAQLAALVAPSAARTQTRAKTETRHVEEAFALISARAPQLTTSTDVKMRAELLRAIAALHRTSRAGSLSQWLASDVPLNLSNLDEHVRMGARRVSALLPARLANLPAWIGAGAAAGALGCIAVAALAHRLRSHRCRSGRR